MVYIIIIIQLPRSFVDAIDKNLFVDTHFLRTIPIQSIVSLFTSAEIQIYNKYTDAAENIIILHKHKEKNWNNV